MMEGMLPLIALIMAVAMLERSKDKLSASRRRVNAVMAALDDESAPAKGQAPPPSSVAMSPKYPLFVASDANYMRAWNLGPVPKVEQVTQ